MERERSRKNWQVNLILTAGVMATVLAALVLAQLDALQSRAAPERARLPIINVQATAVAIGQIIPLLIAPVPGEPEPEAVPVVVVPDDQNPRPDIITGISEEGVIYTVCGEVPEGWLLYTVQPGDTLAALAAAVQATEPELAAANCLPDSTLSAGMQVLVPREPAASLCGPPQWWVRYQVQSGDTLGSLARSRGTTIDEILRANCRDSLDLVAGQSIFLPPGSGSGASPVVPQPSLTPLPTGTFLPTATIIATPTPRPPQPTSIASPQPTVVVPSPIVPTATPPVVPTIPPTNTPVTPPTNTPVPPPTNTPPPPPTNTPPPPPTNTPVPPPTNTPPPPPTNTPPPPPTNTPVPPPTDTPVPPPTDPPPTEPPPTIEPDPTESLPVP